MVITLVELTKKQKEYESGLQEKHGNLQNGPKENLIIIFVINMEMKINCKHGQRQKMETGYGMIFTTIKTPGHMDTFSNLDIIQIPTPRTVMGTV